MTPETTIRDASEKATRWKPLFQENTGASFLIADLDDYLKSLNVIQNAAQIVRVFSHCSDATGGYVQMRLEYQFVPILIGDDNNPVPLYHFVEVLDEVIDYDSVREELPNLSYAQIGGAISFLRKISQVNARGVDFDLLEDRELSKDSAFLDELRKALADEETSRVLNRD